MKKIYSEEDITWSSVEKDIDYNSVHWYMDKNDIPVYVFIDENGKKIDITRYK